MLSAKVKEELLEVESHLRSALKYAAINEKHFVCKQLADMLQVVSMIESTDKIIDKLENRKFGDSGMFGTFFNDLS